MLILKNVTTLHFDPPAVEGPVDVVIEGGDITAVGPGAGDGRPEAKVLDLAGCYVCPGIVCAHNHFYSALARGVTASIPPSYSFLHQLQNLWWRLDRALDEEAVYYSGLVGALEAVRSGCTAVVDHHASPSFIQGSLATLRRGFDWAGLRGILAYEVTDRNGPAGLEAGVRENADFLRSLHEERSRGNHRIEGAVGGHAPFTLGDSALGLMAEVAAETGAGIHCHVSEDTYDFSHAQHHYGLSPLQRLDKAGLLGPKALVVHGVHLTEPELELLDERDAFLLHNARSNMNNRVGFRAGLGAMRNVALGTDGIGADMFEEAKFAFFKNRDAGAGLWPPDYLRFLQNGNLILKRYFGRKFGKVAPGFAADLTVLDYAAPTPLEAGNLAGHFVFGMSSRDVHTVIVNGDVVYADRRFPFDPAPLYAEAAAAAARMWKRMDALD